MITIEPILDFDLDEFIVNWVQFAYREDAKKDLITCIDIIDKDARIDDYKEILKMFNSIPQYSLTKTEVITIFENRIKTLRQERIDIK